MRAIVAGAVARRPFAGGHTWVFLQYLLGLRRLGWDVCFVDWLEPGTAGGASAAYLRAVMERFELPFTLLVRGTPDVAAGLSRAEVLSRARDSSFLLNVAGYLDDEALLAAFPRRVFLDIDPGFPQMWHELGLADVLEGHDIYVTIAGNLGRPTCTIPTCGLDWATTRPPVVLEHWRAHHANGGRFTTVASWRGAYAPIAYDGIRYGLRAHEFRQFAELPRLTGERFELALDIGAAEAPDLVLLDENGWALADPRAVAGNPDSYRRYLAASKAELMVAKGMYVETGSGWFSDRTSCYLASGRPAVVQDTGILELYPTGEGLLAFSTVDEAVAGVEAVAADYRRHARAARELAEQVFDSDLVLSELLERIAA